VKARLLAFSLVLLSAPLLAQTPAATAPDTHKYSNPLGFSYVLVLPADWQVVDSQTASSQAKEKATQNATSEAEKKGVACTQIGLTARHLNPISAIVQVALPYGCFGQQLARDDLPGFGAGTAEGFKQNFDIGDPEAATYTLGSHHLWAERVHGTLKGQTDRHYTIEISCVLLGKAAVCWMTMAADDASLAIFEHGAVTLEDDPPAPLVPAGTFKQ